ncbi:MAG: M12 family metallo-peptidase [Planctomycetota bacterium]
MNCRTKPRAWALALTMMVIAGASAPTSLGAGEVIQVLVLVDEEEATNPRTWQPRLAQRIERASQILSRYTRVKLKVHSFGTWKSTNHVQEFSASLREFEKRVDPGAAHLAIGFSSQYKFQRGRSHLGGTRGPLRKHILIRENAPSVLEPERVEVLVHELGHFFGAAHSTSENSVMRPVVGDGRARSRAFEVGFDPENAQILRLIGNEVRTKNVRRFQELSPQTLKKLKPHYQALARENKKDVTADQFLFMVDLLLDAHQRGRLPTQPPRN